MSCDPAGTVDGLNLYGFVGGNPPKDIDIAGYCSENRAGRGKAKKKKGTSRIRDVHYLSEGESESENPNIVYRSLRKDENVTVDGIQPHPDADNERTISQHIGGGGKSAFVSFTRSLSVAGAWASKKSNMVAVVDISTKVEKDKAVLGDSGREVYDFTQEEVVLWAKSQLGDTAINYARASQEVLIKGGVGKESIIEVYSSEKLRVKDFMEAKEKMELDMKGVQGKDKLFRSRAEVKRRGKAQTPQPFRLRRVWKKGEDLGRRGHREMERGNEDNQGGDGGGHGQGLRRKRVKREWVNQLSIRNL